MTGAFPQIGDVFLMHCKPMGLDWGYYHLLVIQFFQTVQYRDDTCAARCLVLESGQKYEIYADELSRNGEKIA